MYVSLALYVVLGIAAGYVLAKGIKTFISNRESDDTQIVSEETKKDLVTFTGNVNAVFEGDNKAVVSFDHDVSMTVTQGTENKSRYFTITNASGTVATIYASYEGARGYSAADYLAEIIAKKIPTVSAPTNVTYGDASWMQAGTVATEWHLSPEKDGQWLLIVESKKADNKKVAEILKTLTVK